MEELKRVQEELVFAKADAKVLKQKLEMTEGQFNQLATEYATFRYSVSQSDWQRAINEKDAMIAQLQEYTACEQDRDIVPGNILREGGG